MRKFTIFSLLSVSAFSLIVVLASSFVWANSKTDDFREIEIHQSNHDPRLIHRAPEKEPLQFVCLWWSDTGCLLISANKTVNAEVVIQNQTLGEDEVSFAQFSPVSQAFHIVEAGQYILTITLSNGDVYYGEFEVE